ncbi:hypothetical protein CPB84DRAFT_1848657 [Gymnopilus junonius]|uniref:Uncharacterized protein n=1 Tax=Gymnopilus junonius TaxID=109634 RepID=A0A9P5NLE5_GYMJU|nr:hypothetical protein CPB84DRAFT_1848657 [Gymnopilus junonius]
MATGRVYATRKLKRPVRQCLTLAAADLSAGIVFSILSATTCNEETNCTERGPCICILPMRLVVFALLADIIADIATIRMNYMMLFGVDFGSERFRKSLLVFGFSSTALTLIIGIVCWTLYISHLSGYPMVVFSLVHLVAITSLIASNMPIFIGTFCRWLYRKNVGNQNRTVLLEGMDSDEIRPKAITNVLTGTTVLGPEVIPLGQISTTSLSTILSTLV